MVKLRRRFSWITTLALLCGFATAPTAWAAHEHCGDDVVDPDEGCDDGNRDNGDGCSATCRPEMLSCGVSDPSAASCGSDRDCGFGNECRFEDCTPSVCGCGDNQGPLFCTKDCRGSCVKKEIIVCADESHPACRPSNSNADVWCVDFRGNATPRPNGDKCWSDGDCGPTGLCVYPDCVGSTCFCTPGHGWSCTEVCGGEARGTGWECRYPGQRLPPGHPICSELNNGQGRDEGCIYPAQAEPTNNAPALGGLGAVLGLGLLGLRRRGR